MLPALLLALLPAARANQAPVALAGRAFLAYPGERIVLNGAESYDPDGDTLAFQWVQTHGPGVVLSGAQSANPEFDARVAGTYTFELVVTDGELFSEPDEVDVIVVDPAIGESIEGRGCATGAPAGLIGLLLGGLVIPRRRG